MRRGAGFVLVALVALSIAELAAFILVGQWIGFGWAVLAALATSALGAVLLRREGARAWRGFRAAAERGEPPGARVTDGLVGLGAALLLAIPGFLTDLVGLLVLVPPVRRLANGRAQRAAEGRLTSAVAGDLFGPRRVKVHQGDGHHRGDPAPPGPTIEGEILD